MIRQGFTAAVAAIAGLCLPSGTQAAAGAGVYLGAGCTGLAQMPRFQALLGRRPAAVTDFADASSWSSMISSANWSAQCWGSGYRMVESVPMLTGSGGSLATGASGAYNANFYALGQALVADHQSFAMLRIGWEFNGSWYSWAAANDPASFVAYYRQIVTTLRSVPGEHFKFVWNPTLGAQQIAPDQLYPGNDVVDLIGEDVYNQSWRPQDTDPATRWAYLRSQPYGLDWAAAFARQHGKSIILPEWGTGTRPDGHGGGDDPLFIANMAAWIKANHVILQDYWDYDASDFDGQISTGTQPLSAAAYASAFGTPTAAPVFALAAVQPAVPEPASWAMLLAGFAAVGTALRRRSGDPSLVPS